MKKIVINDVYFGGDSLGLILGPCVIESRDHSLIMAESIYKITNRLGFKVVFKSSFDKANRSSISSFRGLGFDEGLRILSEVKKEIGCPIITDIHESSQAKIVAEVVDVIQIPAFLCRQTDLLVSAAKTGRTINVKKGQFLAPWDMKGVVDKLTSTGLPKEKIMLCERGTFFGYNQLVVDYRGLIQMREFGTQICMDATHCVQQPGGKGDSSGGNRDYAPYMAYASTIFKPDAIFMETHEDPDNAPSDGPNMIKLDDMEKVVKTIKAYNDVSV